MATREGGHHQPRDVLDTGKDLEIGMLDGGDFATAVYSKKVEFLWQMVLQTLDILRSKKKEQEEGVRKGRRKGRRQSPQNVLTFLGSNSKNVQPSSH